MTEPTAHVFDLDGVVRDFAPGDTNPMVETSPGLPAGPVSATAFAPDVFAPVPAGRAGVPAQRHPDS